MTRSLTVAALSTYLFLLLTMTLAHQQGARLTAAERVNLTPFRTIAGDLASGGRGFWINTVGNVVVFTPLGGAILALGNRRARAWHAGLAGAALSLTIEVLQYPSGRRFSDVDDVILNTAGALLGFTAAALLRRRWRGGSGGAASGDQS